MESKEKSKISIIVPCYNEEDTLKLFYPELTKVIDSMKNIEWELIFINDGSKDKTLKMLKELQQSDARVKYVSFSRNFGKEAAMFAGLEKATGDYVAVMDADLQDPPTMLVEMYDILKTGEYDCVGTRRVTRKGEPKFLSFFARLFYKIMRKISDMDIVDGARDFRLMTKQMKDAIVSMKEYNRFSKGIFTWVGFNTKWLEYENITRAAGKTKFSFWKYFKYSIEGITAFSTFPLVIATVIGILFCIIAVILIIVIIVKTLLYGDPATGWPSLMCIVLFVGGVQLFCTGIIGQYIAKSYLEVKKRPVYIVKEEA
ncbi:MAG: glycosyltransferase family 2 protein [Oscillospiraceae bacterium]|nr:glycosyltransferase family 2 protein [Oscillospiraceae bacterium]